MPPWASLIVAANAAHLRDVASVPVATPQLTAALEETPPTVDVAKVNAGPTAVQLGLAAGSGVAALLATGYRPKSGFARRLCHAVGFMVCSSCLLLCNKLAVHYSQLPLAVTFCQLGFSSVVVLAGHVGGVVELDRFEWRFCRPFFVIGATFLLVVANSAMILQDAHVETMIIVRASAILFVAPLECFFLSKPVPSFSSTLSLAGVVCATALYCMVDSDEFSVRLSGRIAFWFSAFCFDQIYIKSVINRLRLSTWTNVAWTNTIAGLLLLPFAYTELRKLPHVTSATAMIILASCLLGSAMSYFGYAARESFSATAFTLLGNVCKTFTIIGNCLTWDRHASTRGLACLAAALIAAYMYDDSRTKGNKPARNPEDLDERGGEPDARVLTRDQARGQEPRLGPGAGGVQDVGQREQGSLPGESHASVAQEHGQNEYAESGARPVLSADPSDGIDHGGDYDASIATGGGNKFPCVDLSENSRSSDPQGQKQARKKQKNVKARAAAGKQTQRQGANNEEKSEFARDKNKRNA